MASQNYDRLGTLLANGSLAAGTSVFRALLVTSTYTFSAAHQFVSDITNELSGGNYARVTVTLDLSASGDTTTIRINNSASNVVTFTALQAAAGTPAKMIIYKQTGGDDSTPANDDLVTMLDIPSPPTPNGQDYRITVTNVGIAIDVNP